MGIHGILLDSLFHLAAPGCSSTFNRRHLPGTSQVNYAGERLAQQYHRRMWIAVAIVCVCLNLVPGNTYVATGK